MVKRARNLMERICLSENMEEAFLRAAKGKRGRAEVRRFADNLEENLSGIASGLACGCYEFSSYRKFRIYDPKQRDICAAVFRDRVAFHAMMRICHDVFDSYQIYDSYASRIGKGVYAALARAQRYCRGNLWFAKIDVVKYFDSIDHDVMLAQLCRLFREPLLLQTFQHLLCTYETAPGKGLPIGNLTSQYFANHYLSVADHYCKEILGVGRMIRYMDDVVMFSDDCILLQEWCYAYRSFLSEHLKLKVHPVVMNRTCFGLPFLGYVVYPEKFRLSGTSRTRFRRRMAARRDSLTIGTMSERKYQERVTALYAFIDKADVRGFKRKVHIDGLFP